MASENSLAKKGEFLLYKAQGGDIKVEVFFQNETVWLTQKALSELFGVKIPAINKHLKNIFESGELDKESVISILETTATDGKNYRTQYYNLDAIGKVSGLEAKLKAEGEYKVYRKRQDAEYVSDFDREIKRLKGKQ